MYPQTHVYFSHLVLGRLNDALVLGSIFPDLALGSGLTRQDTHERGHELLIFAQQGRMDLDFALGSIIHGVNPAGLDYYGDEHLPGYERGYCFEKGRQFIAATISACRIPPEMGWWKAHNIVEMGIELHIARRGPYAQYLQEAFHNTKLTEEISHLAALFYGVDIEHFRRRFSFFPRYIEIEKTTARRLAEKYNIQMQYRHGISIDITQVSYLIEAAAEVVGDDMENFFKMVKGEIQSYFDKIKVDELPKDNEIIRG